MECRDSRRFEGRLLPSLLAFLWMAMIVRPECVAALEPETLSFNIHVRPILSDKCFACHGFDSKKRQAELRLDTSQGSRENHNGRAAIVGKDLAASEMWRRITTTDETELMPPAESHKTLSAKEKEIIRLWIEQGANYQKHWAFEDLASDRRVHRLAISRAFLEARSRSRKRNTDSPGCVHTYRLATHGRGSRSVFRGFVCGCL